MGRERGERGGGRRDRLMESGYLLAVVALAHRIIIGIDGCSF